MARIKTRLPKGGTLILLWIGVLVLLGAVGWGIGWLVPRVLAPDETPTQMTRSTASPTMVPVSTLAPTVPEVTDVPPTPADDDSPTGDGSPADASPESTAESSADPTAAPVIEPTLSAEESEVVQSGDGLFQVCRRHCPERWPPDDDALTTYAQQVTELNGMSWPNPALSPGQILKMPPCPER